MDYRRTVEDRADLLLTTAFNDNEYIILASRFSGQQVLIETNGIKFFECESALEYLYKQRWIDKKDTKGEVFILTDLGIKKARTLKFI
ncbi:MAG: hypothetical protein KKF54_00520 [Candidatus Omnitrophica bacterium]|nr:hypothetical protein [Candidatus Omnitrophota bacterium]